MPRKPRRHLGRSQVGAVPGQELQRRILHRQADERRLAQGERHPRPPWRASAGRPR
ncbi:hypothetical protein [Streptomyces sp. NPDC059970]|uniref:hypothetical protein n=1 Tax=Streptomyces sp. NPDC059970 TaxID=3347019 RepID=UPI0036CF78E8